MLLMRRVSSIDEMVDRLEADASVLGKTEDYDGAFAFMSLGCDECERIYMVEAGYDAVEPRV